MSSDEWNPDGLESEDYDDGSDSDFSLTSAKKKKKTTKKTAAKNKKTLAKSKSKTKAKQPTRKQPSRSTKKSPKSATIIDSDIDIDEDEDNIGESDEFTTENLRKHDKNNNQIPMISDSDDFSDALNDSDELQTSQTRKKRKKSNVSNKSNKSNKSGKSTKSNKSNKSTKSNKSNKSTNSKKGKKTAMATIIENSDNDEKTDSDLEFVSNNNNNSNNSGTKGKNKRKRKSMADSEDEEYDISKEMENEGIISDLEEPPKKRAKTSKNSKKNTKNTKNVSDTTPGTDDSVMMDENENNSNNSNSNDNSTNSTKTAKKESKTSKTSNKSAKTTKTTKNTKTTKSSKTSPAKSGKNSSKAKAPAKLKGDEATERIRDYARSWNKPFTTKMVETEVRNTIGLTQIKKSCEELNSKNILETKAKKIYWYNQQLAVENIESKMREQGLLDENEEFDCSSIVNKLDVSNKEQEQVLQNKMNILNGLKAEYNGLISQPTDEQIDSELEQKQNELNELQGRREQIEKKMSDENGGGRGGVMSEEDLLGYHLKFYKYYKAWKDRKGAAMEMIEKIWQEKTAKEVIKKILNCETDEDCGANMSEYKDMFKVAQSKFTQHRELLKAQKQAKKAKGKAKSKK